MVVVFPIPGESIKENIFVSPVCRMNFSTESTVPKKSTCTGNSSTKLTLSRAYVRKLVFGSSSNFSCFQYFVLGGKSTLPQYV